MLRGRMALAAASRLQCKRTYAMSLRQPARLAWITLRMLSAGLLGFTILFVTMTAHGQPAPQPDPAMAAPAPSSTVPAAPENPAAHNTSTAPPAVSSNASCIASTGPRPGTDAGSSGRQEV